MTNLTHQLQPSNFYLVLLSFPSIFDYLSFSYSFYYNESCSLCEFRIGRTISTFSIYAFRLYKMNSSLLSFDVVWWSNIVLCVLQLTWNATFQLFCCCPVFLSSLAVWQFIEVGKRRRRRRKELLLGRIVSSRDSGVWEGKLMFLKKNLQQIKQLVSFLFQHYWLQQIVSYRERLGEGDGSQRIATDSSCQW